MLFSKIGDKRRLTRSSFYAYQNEKKTLFLLNWYTDATLHLLGDKSTNTIFNVHFCLSSLGQVEVENDASKI